MDYNAPIIIGGVGGSGTRVVTQIVQNAGVYQHGYLNGQQDNVFFCRIISSHPYLWRKPHCQLRTRFNAFTKLFFGKPLSPLLILAVYRSMTKPKHKQTWLLLRRSAQFRKDHCRDIYWGFKDPRTQFYIRQLATHFQGCRYIYVIRHGLDMAFSSNLTQLELWGNDFNIAPHNPLPHRQLDFWIAVNNWAIEQCRQYLPGRFYVLSFDQLCATPEEEIAKLLDFLHLQPTQSLQHLSQLVDPPMSTGRYKSHPDIFSAQQVQAVRNLGFEVSYD